MAKKTTSSVKDAITKVLDLDRAFIIFSLVYSPVAVLFLENGTLSEVLLGIYTLLMVVLGIILISGFILYVSDLSNDTKKNMGGIYLMYILNFLIPMAMFKVFAYVGWRLLPTKHDGLLCTIKEYIVDMYILFEPQRTLNLVILVSLLLFSVALIHTLIIDRKK